MVSDILKCAYFHYRGFAGRAVAAMEKARRDVAAYEAALQAGDTKAAARHRRYASSPWGKSYGVTWQEPRRVGNLPFPEYAKKGFACVAGSPDSVGLREVGRVVPECGGRNGIWDKSDGTGWHTDPYGDVFRDGSGLCYGLVFQLPSRDGKARFVAGYQFGGVEGGPCLDLGTIYSETVRGAGFSSWDYVTEYDAARDAARAADSMAQHAAEEERDYQAAWQAGTQWAEKGEEIAALKREAVQLLQERREARKAGAMAYPAMCEGLRKLISGIVADIAEKREERAKLKSGDAPRLCFYPDERLQGAFNEGAGV